VGYVGFVGLFQPPRGEMAGERWILGVNGLETTHETHVTHGKSAKVERAARPTQKAKGSKMDEAKRRPEWKNTFRVGDYTCEMTYNEGGTLRAEWRPNVPRNLPAGAMEEYRAGRDALMGEVAAALGGRALVIEP
jgi:hypothetical protein